MRPAAIVIKAGAVIRGAAFTTVAILLLPGPLHAQEDCIQLEYADTLEWSGAGATGIALADHRELETPSYDSDLYGFLVRGSGGACLKHFLADYAFIVDTCREAVSGRVHAVIFSGAGQHFDIRTWSVDPATGNPVQGYVEAWGESYHWDGARELIGPDGACLWNDRQAARQSVDDAVRELRIGDTDTEAVMLRDDAPLPVRPLESETVQRLLHSLEGVATLEGAIYASAQDRANWRVVQIRGDTLCDAHGAVLVLNRGTGQWYSIYDIASGCIQALDYPFYGMYVRDGHLAVSACNNSDCPGPGAHYPYAINLNTWRVRMVQLDDPQWDDQWNREYQNPPITDVGPALFDE